MFMNGDPLHTRSLAPQPPLAPEIEGYLKKLKRKTSNLTGSWNKRWFFVDPKRLEFGYAANKTPNAPRSSIYLNDITAVLQFDDTHFQIESRTRNFFLCGESKASTTCWVKSLDEYRKKLVEYEREMHKLKVSASASGSSNGTTASNQSKLGVEGGKSSGHKKKKPSLHDNPARDSLQDSSSSASLSISASSSSNLADEKLPRHVNVDDVAASDEKRTPSPIENPRRRENRESKSRGAAGSATADRIHESDSKSRNRPRDRDGDRESQDRRSRESDRDRERGTRERTRDRDNDDDRSSKRDRSTSAQRRGNTGGAIGSSSQASGSRAGSRTNSGKAAHPGHPTHGYVMHAWMDEYE